MENANANCNNPESNHVGVTKLCFGCKSPIEDDFSLRVSPDLEWHAACLTCAECHQPLDETCTCFMKDGHPYCRNDYMRLFGVACSHCLLPVTASELVMRAKNQVYHLSCFQCSMCTRKLVPGEQFGLSAGKLFCKMDFDALPPEAGSSPDSCESGPGGPTSSSTKRSNSEKGPRVRTVLSEQQLQTLRTVYASNPRPDALLKEHLVEITGLNPRVIRVWFQNKRCKDKKRAIQAEAARLQSLQQQQQQAKPVMPPLTPQTPLTPDSMGQISPHPGMSAFTYPPAPAAYDSLSQTLPPTTPTQPSPIVTYHQNPIWGSPSNSVGPFETTTDFSSPISTEHQQTFIYSTASTTQPSHFAF